MNKKYKKQILKRILQKLFVISLLLQLLLKWNVKFSAYLHDAFEFPKLYSTKNVLRKLNTTRKLNNSLY